MKATPKKAKATPKKTQESPSAATTTATTREVVCEVKFT